MMDNNADVPIDLTALARPPRAGAEERVIGAVMAHVRARSSVAERTRVSLWSDASTELVRRSGVFLVAAAAIILLCAVAMPSLPRSFDQPGIEVAMGIPAPVSKLMHARDSDVKTRLRNSAP